MTFVNTILHKSGEKEELSKEKTTIMLFETMCNIGEPNLNLAEKLAFLIIDKVNAKHSESISFENYEGIIKDTLLKEAQTELLQSYILKKSKPDQSLIDSELKDRILKNILNIEDADSASSKLIAINTQINKLQNNQSEKLNKKIFDYIREGYFYPSSTILREIALNQQISSGYNFKIKDTLESIFDDLALSSKVQKYGSSVSVNLSNVRSEKEKVKSINKKACGPLKIADLFISAKSMIGYNTNTSNNLFYISIEHPDIISFINNGLSKDSENFAILIPDRFIENYINNQDYSVDEQIRKICPSTIFDLVSSKIVAGEKIDLIFIDTINKKNPFTNYDQYAISSVGYQPVLEDNTFVSGVIDVSKLVNATANSKTFDWQRLKSITWDAIEFLDNSIDLSKHINEEYTQKAKESRQIYLSITGFATLLSKLNIPYNSDDAICFADSLSDFIGFYSKLKSTELSKTKGPFLKYIKSKYELPNFNFEKTPVQKTLFSNDMDISKKLIKNMPTIDWIELRNNIKKYGLRNSTTFSIISSDFYSVANECSNGIKPMMNYKQISWVNGYKSDKINKDLSLLVSDLNLNWSEEEVESAVPEDIKKRFPKAKHIEPLFLIRLQAAFAKNIDGTVNTKIYLSEDISAQEIKSLIIESHKIGNSLFLPEKLNGHQKEFNTEDRKGLKSL
ncbi:MAG: hypothetical protein WCX82_04240 [archaeon]|jgi:ribonucleoside-diphosphate reductase alpha chain